MQELLNVCLFPLGSIPQTGENTAGQTSVHCFWDCEVTNKLNNNIARTKMKI